MTNLMSAVEKFIDSRISALRKNFFVRNLRASTELVLAGIGKSKKFRKQACKKIECTEVQNHGSNP